MNAIIKGNSRKWLLLLGLCLIPFLFVITWRPSEPSLLGRATRVGSTVGWPLGVGGAVDWEPACVWLSDHEVLHFTGDTMRGYQAALLDTRTNIDSPLPALNLLSRARTLDASPDGRWIVWVKDTPHGTKLFVATRTNPTAIFLPMACGFTTWLPDSQHWAAVFCDPHLYPTRQSGMVMHPDQLTVQSFYHPYGRRATLPYVFNSQWIMVFPAPGHVILSPTGGGQVWQYGPSRAIDFMNVDFSAQTLITRTFRVPLPDQPGAQDVTLKPSPAGDRILWYYTSYQPSLLAWAAQVLRHYAPPNHSVDIWVSQSDGSSPRKVGHLDIGRHDHLPTAVRWTLDGKRIIFVYRNALWTLPAN